MSSFFNCIISGIQVKATTTSTATQCNLLKSLPRSSTPVCSDDDDDFELTAIESTATSLYAPTNEQSTETEKNSL